MFYGVGIRSGISVYRSSRLKSLSNYWMDRCGIVERHGWIAMKLVQTSSGQRLSFGS